MFKEVVGAAIKAGDGEDNEKADRGDAGVNEGYGEERATLPPSLLGLRASLSYSSKKKLAKMELHQN